MSDQRPRGRGRGRGRGSEQPQQQPQQVRGPGGQAPQGAWAGGRPQQPPSQPQGAWGGQQRPAPGASWGPRPAATTGAAPRPQGQATAGRAVHRQAVERITEQVRHVDIGASGDASAATADVGASAGSGRGATRGRRNVAVDILRTRPATATTKCGTYGQTVRLQSNYFELLSHPDWRLYMYRVDFSPDEDHTGLRKKMMRDQKKILGGYIFDGTVLFSSRRYHPDPMELTSKHPNDDTPVNITVRLTSDLAFGDYHYIQLFNLIMRRCLSHLKLQLVGRNFFDALAKIEVRDYKMELWPGYITSIRQHEQKILMVCEVAHKVMRRDNVLDLLRECFNESKSEGRKLFNQRIVGAIVLTDYNNHTYRIDDVDWDVTPQHTFEMKDGSKISYQEYYRSKYQKNIRDVSQPMLVSRAKQREIRAGLSEMVYLVPELCRMTGLTDAQRANFQLMRALSEHMRVVPEGRIQRLNKFLQRLLSVPEAVQCLSEWDLKFANNLVELGGRILPPETIIQGPPNQTIKIQSKDADWTKDLRSNPMLVSANVQSWVYVCPTEFKAPARDFVGMLAKAAGGMRFMLPQPRLQEINDDRVPNYLAGLESAINNYRPSCILCIVSNNKADRYSAIKKKCCVDRAVPTQVFVARHFRNPKGLMSIATKVAIQINCKLGGAPWTVEFPLKGLMVIGFDVCHDSIKKEKSYGALVASLNNTCSRYFSAVSQHSGGEEISNFFALNIIKAIHCYKELNGTVPSRIIIYRDGVGDGQIPYVHEHEVQLILKKLKEFYEGESLKLSFIIVSKRINTRFFLNGRNPPPGTVVDDVVTLPERYDFFIVSQAVRQGTVAPTSYNVIYDTCGLDPDKIQRLTYKMCHMYYNWSGTVRVPAPCQYAHKLAFLAGQALHRDPNPQLEKLLYFL